MGLIALRENDLDIPSWPLRLNPDWEHAGNTRILVPGIREAGNLGLDTDTKLQVRSGANVATDYRVPSHLDVSNAPANSVLNVPRVSTSLDYFQLTNSADKSADFTWSVWVKMTDAAQSRSTVVGKDPSFNAGIGLYLEESASPHFRFFRGLWSDVAFTPTWNGYDVWHHISCSNTGGNTGVDSIFMNGVRGTDNVARALTFANQDIDLGAMNGVRTARCQIAHFVCLDKALTDNERYNLFDPATRFKMYERVNSKKFFLVPDAAPGSFKPLWAAKINTLIGGY